MYTVHYYEYSDDFSCIKSKCRKFDSFVSAFKFKTILEQECFTDCVLIRE